MSCIVGIKYKNKVFVGADSCSVSEGDDYKRIISEPKVFKNNHLVIAFCGSFRAGRSLTKGYWTPPKSRKIEVIGEHIRVNLSKYGSVRNSEGIETSEINGIVAYGKHMYEFYLDFHCGGVTESYTSLGAGKYYALGSLWETEKMNLGPEERINRALECASYFCPSVAPPFVIETT